MKLTDLEVFEGTEQPETCRQCGSRTDFIEVTDKRQLHLCNNDRCRAVYVVEWDKSPS